VNKVAEIEEAIEQLSVEEQRELRRWFLEHPPQEENDDILVPAAYRQKILDGLDQS